MVSPAQWKKGRSAKLAALDRDSLGWLMGLEPTTTGITIQPSKANFPFLINALRF
jgi:hypothetical protein